MAHLRHLRQEQVRQELLDPECRDGVTVVAQRWGFGELPSQTRQRGT